MLKKRPYMSYLNKIVSLFPVLLIGTVLHAEITVSNAGIPGNSSAEALARVDRDVLSEKPYAVIVLLGANDALNPRTITPPEEFGKNMYAIGQKLLQNGVKKVYFVTTFPVVESILRRRAPIANELVPPPNTLEDHFRKYGDAVFSAAKKLDITVFDSFPFFAANGGATEKSSLFRTPANSKALDGCHLTATGYAKFAEFLVSKIRGDLPDGCHVVCLGDSITYGVHVKGAGGIEGEPYPAQLWKLLNPELAAQGRKPTSKVAGDGNLIPNSSLEQLDEKGFPKYWKFWQKDRDSVKFETEGDTRFFRVSRDSKTSARLRPETIRIVPGRYRWSMQMRGKGIAEVSVYLYHPVRPQDLMRTKLTSDWKAYSGEITVPARTSQLALVAKIHVQADVKDVSLVKIDDDRAPEAGKKRIAPAAETGSPKLRRKPASKAAGDGNLILNASLEELDEKGFPKDWIFWRKDRDSVKVETEGNARFFRVSRDSKTSARLRSELIRIVPGKYRWSMQMRGKGVAEVSVYLYHPVRPQDVLRTKLTSDWKTYSGEITVPARTTKLALVAKIHVQADIKDVSLVRIDDDRTPEVGKRSFAPAVEKRSFAPGAEIGSPELSLNFSSPESGAAITGIRNRKGRQFIHFQPARGIWSIRLKQTKIDRSRIPPVTGIACDPEMDDSADSIGKDGESSNDIIIDSSMAERLGARCSVEKLSDKLLFRWKNIRVGKEENALDVSISVSVAPSGGMIFSGSFVNRSQKQTVFYFNYPQISGMGKINGRGEDDFLATPHYLGRLIKNPSSGKLFKNSRIFRGNNSGHSMHFDALYSKDGDGLFFGVWDPDQNIKRWDLTSSAANGFGWTSIHLPDNMKCPPPQKWTIPYPVEVRSFTGDWYDAAQIYRQWAIKQEWCGEGTLAQRRGKDIPAWFLDVTVWHHISVNNILRGHKTEFENALSFLKEHKNAVWLTHWGVDNKRYDFPTPDRFPLTKNDKAALAKLRKAGCPISGYIQFTAWTRTMPSFGKHPDADDNLLRNYYGQILSWGGTGYRKDSMFVYPGKLWQQVLGEVVEKMVRSGFTVAYLDSGNHGGHHLNFTPACTSRSGGGNDYVKNSQKLLKYLRARGREINPDFCTTTESFWEGNLHCLDAVLCVNSPSAYLEGDRVTAIPLAPAVYHDYAQLYATHYGIADLAGHAEGLIAKTSQALLWGIMPGWELPHVMYHYSDPERVRRTSKLRMEAWDAGRKFLQYGKMLRPPVVKGDNPELTIPWGIGWRKAVYTVKAPAVSATAYAANDGSLGVIFYNLDKIPHRVTAALDDPEYVGSKTEMKSIYPADFIAKNDSGRLELTLPAQTPVILQLR